MPETLTFTPEVAAATEPIYEKIKDSVPRFEWELHAPLIFEINRLKKERNAIILGHNYMVPEIFHGVSDYVGDSLGLSIIARDAEADVSALEREIDELVYALYGLTPEEIAIVEGSRISKAKSVKKRK